MSSRNWPNSSPLPPSPRQSPFVPVTPRLPLRRPYNGQDLNLHDNHCSVFAPGSAYNPYALAPIDSRFQIPYNMSNLGNMNNRSLVAAAIGSSFEQEEPQSQSLVLPDLASHVALPSPRSRPAARVSTLATPPTTEDALGEVERNTNPVAADRLKSQSKKRRHSEISSQDEDYEEDALAETDQTSAKALNPRRSTRTKRTVRQETPDEEAEEDDATEDIALPAPAKQVARKIKLPAKRLVRKKPQGTKVPENLETAGPADKMMWLWKNSGRDWEDIRTEWARLTGIKPGKSSLSVRYIKLNENFARNGAAGSKHGIVEALANQDSQDLDLIKFRKEAEEELMTGLWHKVAEKMLAFNPLSEHNPKDLKKRYDLIVRSGYDIEQLLKDDIAQQKEEEEAANDSVNKAEGHNQTDLGIHQPALGEPVSSRATPCVNHGAERWTHCPLVEIPALTRALRSFTDGTADEVDDDFHHTPAPQEDRSDLTSAENIEDFKKQTFLESTIGESFIVSSPVTTPAVVSSSFNSSLVAYDSESD